MDPFLFLAVCSAALVFALAGRYLLADLTEQRGIDVKLYVETAAGVFTLVGGLRTASININGDSIDASHAGTGGWRKKLAGMKMWDVSADTVVLVDLEDGGFDAAFAALKSAIQTDTLGGNTLAVEIVYPDGSKDAGTAIVTSLSLTAPYDGVAEGSISLEGSGALVYTAAP